jgi:hypothetical protein
MTQLERIQLPSRDEIKERAIEHGVPEELAGYLGRAANEFRRSEEIYSLVSNLSMSYSCPPPVSGIKKPEKSFPEIMLEHYEGCVAALVTDESQREAIIDLWEGKSHQKQWLERVEERSNAK